MNRNRVSLDLMLIYGTVACGAFYLGTCMHGCSGEDRVETRYVETQPVGVTLPAYGGDGGYNEILPYGGYFAVNRDGEVLGQGGASACCGGGITITQTQEGGDGDQSQGVTIDQSDNSENSGEGGGTEQSLVQDLTSGPIPIEALSRDGQQWIGSAGTHVAGQATPIELVNDDGDTLTGQMSRYIYSGMPLRLTLIPADGGEPTQVLMYREGVQNNYSVE